MFQFESDDQQSVFEYLDELRASGATNMFGALPYMISAFDYLPKVKLSMYLGQWMGTFSERRPASERHIQEMHNVKTH